MSPQAKRKFIKNIEARVLPFSIIALMIIASFASVVYIYQDDNVVSGATVDQFSYYKEITLESDQVPSTQTNCPILINLSSDTDLASDALDTGNDIAFFDDGDNQLDHEIELFNGTTGKLVTWVRIPSLSSSADTSIKMYYGDADIGSSAENPTGVWDANYLFVHHFVGASAAAIVDSTSNNYDVNGAGGTPVYNQEKGIGYSIQLVAADDEYLYIDDADGLTQGVQTVTAWFNPNNVWGAAYSIVTKYDDDAREYKVAVLNSYIRSRYYKDSSNYVSESTDDTHILTNGTWQGISISHDDNKDIKHYLLGKLRASSLSESGTYTTLTNGAADVRIGAALHGAGIAAEYDGYISELRMSSVVRDSDWCVVQYNTMKNSTQGAGDCFFTLGSESSPAQGTYELGMVNNTEFTWDGLAGENVWANNSGDYYEHGVIYTNTSGTTEYVDEICIDFTDFDSEIFQENLSLAFINTSDGNWDDITSMVSVPAADGNFSLTSAEWTTGIAGGWADGTNPFTVINYNSSIEFRMICNISSGASAGTYTNSGNWYMRWKVNS